MQLYILDRARTLSGIVESFEYLRWTRRYAACGSFELKAIAIPENVALLKLGNYLWKNDDDECAVIEHLEMEMTEQESIVVSGRFVTSILARRILWGTEVLTGHAGDGIRKLLNNHAITPTEVDRRIDYIDYTDQTTALPIQMQASYKNLLTVLFEICKTYDAGIRTVYDPVTKRFSVQFYKGAVSQAVFSKEYENLIGQVYEESTKDMANTALIAGEGEGAGRALASIIGGVGEDRREIFVDAKDIRSEGFPDDYPAALKFRGQSKLAALTPVCSFDATANPHGNLRYKVDFDLGQMVKVISKPWGVTLDARITEIEESYDESGQSLGFVFGKGALTLLQQMKGAL